MSGNFVNVEEEYLRKPHLKREDVEIIRTWMSQEGHLPTITDLEIALFLNSCYFKLEATKVCIENYYTVRENSPEIFSKRDPFSAELQQALKTVVMFELTKPSKDNYMVILFKLADTNPENFILNDILKRLDLMATLLGPRKGLQDGHVLVFDSLGLQLGHVFRLSILSVKKYLCFMQEAMPIRLKEIHILNVSGITEKFINVLKPFLNKEVADMIHMHKNAQVLSQHLPLEIFPSDYGGKENSTHNLHLESIKIIEDNSKFLLEDEKLKSDESKRQGTKLSLIDTLGVAGSFKKLEFD